MSNMIVKDSLVDWLTTLASCVVNESERIGFNAAVDAVKQFQDSAYVYVLKLYIPYEGGNLLGIYKTEEAAMEAKEKREEIRHPDDYSFVVERYAVQ